MITSVKNDKGPRSISLKNGSPHVELKALWRYLWRMRPKEEPRESGAMDAWISALLAASDPERGPLDKAVKRYLTLRRAKGSSADMCSTSEEDRKEGRHGLKQR